MKAILNNLPWLKVLLYFMAMVAATQMAERVPSLNDFWFFLVVSGITSWILLRLDGKPLTTIPLLPRTRAHGRQWMLGTLAGCGMLLVTVVVTLLLTGDSWHVNFGLDPIYIGFVFLGCLCSCIVQEFVFRGYPFQTMLDHYGLWKAQLVVAVPFALMHVHAGMEFSAILTTALTTGLGSVLFGIAYAKTGHLALPIGLHLGWNFAQALVPRAASGNTAKTLLIVSGDASRYNFMNIVIPYLTVVLLAIAVLAKIKKRKGPGAAVFIGR